MSKTHSRLFEYHPIVGFVEAEGALFRAGVFDLSIVQQIERVHFPESQFDAGAVDGVAKLQINYPR